MAHSENTSWDVLVIGAGAAGMLAAIRAAQRGRRVLLVERNRKVGVKILMSGGTRCNLTHATDARGIVDAFGKPGRFLHSALAALGPGDVVRWFTGAGVPTKVEATGKVFPVSDRALDVQRALLQQLARSGALLVADAAVTGLAPDQDGRWRVHSAHADWCAERVIVTTGGQSYPGCGTRGDGYPWLAELGHTIIPPRPALVPVLVRADWSKALQGITLSDVELTLQTTGDGAGPSAAQPPKRARRAALVRRGSLLFAHFGLSGPVALDISREISRHPAPRSLTLQCNFVPGRTLSSWESHWQDMARRDGKSRVAQDLTTWLPKRMVDALFEQARIPTERRVAELAKTERQQLAAYLTACPFPVSGTLGFEKAEVTSGGVSLDEVDSRTMQSKRAANLYIAGEILDLDGPIGGYNFQAAFSTGWLAGENV